MFDRIRQLVLRIVRLPHDPAPPTGAPGSVRIFRAGKNYYRLRLVGWGAGQLGAAIGIAFSLWFLTSFETEIATHRASTPPPAPALSSSPAITPGSSSAAAGEAVVLPNPILLGRGKTAVRSLRPRESQRPPAFPP